jgi:hypothetical protein
LAAAAFEAVPGVGEALAAGAAGVAEAAGAAGAAVFVGALVVQPEAASRINAATSAGGDFHVLFNTSMLIYF